MIIEKTSALGVIFAAIDELNPQLKPEQRLEKSAATPLFGRNGKLDSMDLVNLIVSTEQKLEDRFAVTLILADERAMSQEKSPFRTVDTLAQYVVLLLSEKE